MILPVSLLFDLFLVSLLLNVDALPTANSTLEPRALAQVITQCTVPNTAALTFDDGPYVWMQDVVKELSAAGAKGTFFVNGNNWRCIYSADSVKGVKYAYSKGHQLASHTWSHKDLTKLTWDQNHDEFWRVEQALERIVGVKPAFIRPPYGTYNDLVRTVASVRGQKLVLWDFDSGDSLGITATQSKDRYNQVANQHPSSILALNHETYDSTVHNIAPYAINLLKSKGYKLVTVAQCLGMQPYQSVGPPQTGTWSC